MTEDGEEEKEEDGEGSSTLHSLLLPPLPPSIRPGAPRRRSSSSVIEGCSPGAGRRKEQRRLFRQRPSSPLNQSSLLSSATGRQKNKGPTEEEEDRSIYLLTYLLTCLLVHYKSAPTQLDGRGGSSSVEICSVPVQQRTGNENDEDNAVFTRHAEVEQAADNRIRRKKRYKKDNPLTSNRSFLICRTVDLTLAQIHR